METDNFRGNRRTGKARSAASLRKRFLHLRETHELNHSPAKRMWTENELRRVIRIMISRGLNPLRGRKSG